MPAARLSPADRDFFDKLVEVIFGNPYSGQRAGLIAQLAPDVPVGDLTGHREALAQIVQARIHRIVGAEGFRRFEADDRHRVELGQRYICYHRLVPRLDAFIERQARRSGSTPAVDFAETAIAELAQCGLDEAGAERYFALFFQLRRAFYFIHGSLAGKCESMQKLRKALWNNIFTHDMRRYDASLYDRMEDFSTLLLGATGTGKGSAAAAIGRSEFIPYVATERRFAVNFADTFIALNLSQFPETLIESELFGHCKGAFTGAIRDHDGVLARCSAHGALFLDEIGEISIPVQIKLLQVLQERIFVPLGGRDKQRFSGRVIAATNQPLAALRRAGRFRDDFYYRLCSDVIEVPTLRQRLAENPGERDDLVCLLVDRIVGTPDTLLIADVLERLEHSVPRGYAWPGNVRELEQAVRRVLVTGRYRGDLADVPTDQDDILVEAVRTGQLTATALLERYCAALYRRLGTYAAVAERTALDPRTARKYVEAGMSIAVEG